MVSLRQLPRVELLEEDARRYSTLDPPTVLAFLSVLVVSAELERIVEPHFARYGLSQGRFTIMMALRRCPHSTATPAYLAEYAEVTRATITGLVDGLEKDGLVERTQSPDDRRSVDVRLTRKGLNLLERVLPDHYARIGRVMETLTKQEKKQLTVLLGKVREGMASGKG